MGDGVCSGQLLLRLLLLLPPLLNVAVVMGPRCAEPFGAASLVKGLDLL